MYNGNHFIKIFKEEVNVMEILEYNDHSNGNAVQFLVHSHTLNSCKGYLGW